LYELNAVTLLIPNCVDACNPSQTAPSTREPYS
jgi:hypothetical protein